MWQFAVVIILVVYIIVFFGLLGDNILHPARAILWPLVVVRYLIANVVTVVWFLATALPRETWKIIRHG